MGDHYASRLTTAVADRPDATEVAEMFSQVTYSITSRELGEIKDINPGAGSWVSLHRTRARKTCSFISPAFTAAALRLVCGSPSTLSGTPQPRAHPVVPCKL